MNQLNANALFDLIGAERLIHLAGVYDKHFDPTETNVEVAKQTLSRTSAFQRLLKTFNDITNHPDKTKPHVRMLLAAQLLEHSSGGFDLYQKRQDFRDAFDAFERPIVYFNQEYTVGFDLDDATITTTVFHEYATILHDEEIIEEALGSIRSEIKTLLDFPQVTRYLQVALEEHLATVITKDDLYIKSRRIEESDGAQPHSPWASRPAKG